MSKATDTEIKEIVRSIDLLTKEVSSLREDIKGLDNRLWGFGGLILAACLGAFLKALDL